MADIKNTFGTSLVSHFKMEESSGSRSDSHGSNTLSEGASGVSSATGIKGTAADFETSASDSFLYRADNNLATTGSFTWSFWVKFESLPGAGTRRSFLGKGTGWSGTTRQYTINNINTGGTHYIEFWVSEDGVGSKFTTSSGVSFDTTNWFHIVCVYEASTSMRVYVNDSEVTNDTTSIPASLHTDTDNFRIARVIGNGHDGLIDEATFWTRALSASDVTTLYNSGSPLEYEVFSVNKSDSSTVTESSTVFVTPIVISVSDSITTQENSNADVIVVRSVEIYSETQSIIDSCVVVRADTINISDTQETNEFVMGTTLPLVYRNSPTPDMVIRYRERGGTVRRVT
jgi:hypothetical protein